MLPFDNPLLMKNQLVISFKDDDFYLYLFAV